MNPTTPVKFAIYGASAIGRFHAEAIRDMVGGELVGVASRNADKAKAFAETHGIRAYDDLEALAAADDVDVVTVTTASGAHLDAVEALARGGKHVLVEKPIEVTTARVDAMAKACDDAGVMLGAILNRRFHPAIDAIDEALEKGRFGRLTLCSAYVKWWRTQAYYDSATWRGTKKLDGGGALMNQAVHTVDQLLHFAGEVKRVSAMIGRVGHEGIEVEDVAVASLEFASGALGSIEATTAAWSDHGHPCEVHLCGTKGTAFLADEKLRHWEFDEPAQNDDSIREWLMADGSKGLGAADPGSIDPTLHRRNFEHFARALRGEEPLKVGIAEARRAVEL